MFHCNRNLWSLGILDLMLLAAFTGCGGKPQETYPVAGLVQWKDGKPATDLVGAGVEFQVIDGVQIRVSPHGEVQADGKFTLRTYEPKDGAPAGKYRVIVTPVLLADPGASVASSPLEARFQDFNTTPLEVTITSAPNDVVLTVERVRGR